MNIISIITPNFNSGDSLEHVYKDLLNQRNNSFEWIIIDGGSTDNSARIARSMQSANEWIRFISEKDFGIYDAINKGIDIARGDYYLVVGSDDYIYKDAIEMYLSEARADAPDIVLSSVVKNGRINGGFRPGMSWAGHQQVFLGNHSVGMLIKKSLHEKYGLYSNQYPMLADGYFLQKILVSDSINIKVADFVAGEFSLDGFSATNKVRSLSEGWMIQMSITKHPLIQVLLFILKIVYSIPKIYIEWFRKVNK
jgi:glycosyltransferase